MLNIDTNKWLFGLSNWRIMLPTLLKVIHLMSPNDTPTEFVIESKIRLIRRALRTFWGSWNNEWKKWRPILT